MAVDNKSFFNYKLQIRFMKLWHIKYDDIRKIIEVMENFEVVTLYCNETLNKTQLSFLESSEFKEIIEESEAIYGRTVLNYLFYNCVIFQHFF